MTELITPGLSESIAIRPHFEAVKRAYQIRPDSLAKRQEVFDVFKSEANVFSPVEDANVRRQAVGLMERIRQEYGEFIPDLAFERVRGSEARIAVVKGDDLYELIRIVSPKEDPEKIRNIFGLNTLGGGFVVLKQPSEMPGWERLSEDQKHAASREVGDTKLAEKEMNYRFFIQGLTHELLHNYQVKDLPSHFIESGAAYYSTQVYKGYPLTPWQAKPFQELVDKYGAEVHKIFFGKGKDKKVQSKILREFQKHEKRLAVTSLRR